MRAALNSSLKGRCPSLKIIRARWSGESSERGIPTGALVHMGRPLAEETLKEGSTYVAALQEAFDTLVGLPAQTDPGHGNNPRLGTRANLVHM